MEHKSKYPSFDVMSEQDAWDDHTQTIVTDRLQPKHNYKFLLQSEADMVRRICEILVDDDTHEVMDYVVQHIDSTLYDSPGEGQRQLGVPKAPDLIREGLKAIEQSAVSSYSHPFTELSRGKQQQILQSVSGSKAGPASAWMKSSQEHLFKKLLNLTLEAYCSHPKVWSEIGYAGPAYPRGYVRTQLGQLDPWEAQPE